MVGAAVGSPVATVLERLEGVRQSGAGWTARCPAHKDRRPSLSIGEGSDGRALVLCRAGCATEDVVAAIGLDLVEREPVPAASRHREAAPARPGRPDRPRSSHALLTGAA